MAISKKTTTTKGASSSDLRSQLKATSIKRLKKRVDEDNDIIGAQSNEYLNLEDGKTIKIRIFPAHPGEEDFYIPKKCYWLTITKSDGESGRTYVLDSVVHGGTKLDICDQYIKWGKKKVAKDSDKLDKFVGQRDTLSAQYSWLSYADKVVAEEPLRAKLWEFKKMVRDGMNKLAFSEDEDDVIEVDPFTDVDEGLPILVKYLKKPNKKKGENFYEVSFPKKVTARPLEDEEVDYFMTLKPLSEVLQKYGIKDFERALEGLQNFDEEHEIGLFDDDDWLDQVETIRSQYDADDEDEEDEKPAKKKTAVKKSTKKVEEPEEEEEDDEEEEEAPKKTSSKKSTKKVVEEEEEDDEEEEAEEEAEEDELDDLDRDELKKYIRDNELEVSVKKSMSDEDIREAIREAVNEEEEEGEEEEDEEEEEEKPKSKLSMNDIRKKLSGK